MLKSDFEIDEKLAVVEERIDRILDAAKSDRQKCSGLNALNGFYSRDFLDKSHYVVVPRIPLPPVDDLGVDGFSRFTRMEPVGITYKNTYFVKAGYEKVMKLHCHELVHVAQWQILGFRRFMHRYFVEWTTFGYAKAPLEKMAHDIDTLFERGHDPFDIPAFVRSQLQHDP